MARGKDMSGKLDKLLDKMDAVAKSGGDFWRPDKGRNVIRILPEVGEMEYFFQEVGRHYNLPDGASEFCPSFTTDGEHECPICDLVRDLYKAGDEKARALAGNLRVRKAFWVNVVVRDPKDKGGDTGSDPRVYTPGVMVFNSLKALLRDPDYGEFYDPEDGVDLVIERTGDGINTEYQVLPRGKRCPLHVDDNVVDGWLDTAIDLSWVMLGDNPDEDKELSEDAVVVLLPYDRMLEKYGVGPGVDVSILQSDEGSGEDEYKASTKSRRRSKPVDDDAGDEEEESGDDSEEPEEEDAVGSALRQRRQRRRRST